MIKGHYEAAVIIPDLKATERQELLQKVKKLEAENESLKKELKRVISDTEQMEVTIVRLAMKLVGA